MQTRSAAQTTDDMQEDREAGFSLLEIMISITILGLLATIVVINVLPLTAKTENILNAALFSKLAKGAWLIQMGRGEHMAEDDFVDALDRGQLSGATLDVFRAEPLPSGHPFWADPRLRITPHIASDTTPSIVAEQALQSARELHAGKPLSLAVSRGQGY